MSCSQGLVTRGFNSSSTIVTRGMGTCQTVVHVSPFTGTFLRGGTRRDVDRQIITVLATAKLVRVNDKRYNITGRDTKSYMKNEPRPRIVISSIRMRVIEATTKILIELKSIFWGRRK